jgi:hypothetical protein
MTSAREDLAIRYSLFAIRYSLFAIRYSLFAIRYSTSRLRTITSDVAASLLFGSHLHRCNRQFPVMTSVAHSLLQIEYNKLQIKQLIILEQLNYYVINKVLIL